MVDQVQVLRFELDAERRKGKGERSTDVNEQAERAQPIGLLSQLSGGQQLARLARIG
ncbi:hypothetical protein PtrV1_06483 [Pyrenophora tritici-repentis]|nr:hypothetical protein PtrV1_06483 [Pyrenophora tritici-repentis]